MSRILLVDDDPLFCAAHARLLATQRHEVCCAASAMDALALLESEPFDLVLTDLMMPEIDGIELATHIRADERYGAMGIMLLTGLAHRETRVRALEFVDEVLTKPVDGLELLLRVRGFFATRSRYAQAAQLRASAPSHDEQTSVRSCLPDHGSDCRPTLPAKRRIRGGAG